MKKSVLICVIAACGMITAIELMALHCGIDGMALAGSIAAIVAIVTGTPSYFIGKLKGRHEK